MTTETLLLRPRACSTRRWKVEGALGKRRSQKIASDLVVREGEDTLWAESNCVPRCRLSHRVGRARHLLALRRAFRDSPALRWCPNTTYAWALKRREEAVKQ